MEKAQALRKEMRDKINAVLTAEQRTQLEADRAAHKGQWGKEHREQDGPPPVPQS
jgi:Spy/CpxP family protein refolding chaperone